LHKNLSEGDIRDYVKKLKITVSTKSSLGQRCRNTFTSLNKTCRKLGISFWEYLKDRLSGGSGGSGVVEYLPNLIRKQAQTCNA
jgi:hypothetical protein